MRRDIQPVPAQRSRMRRFRGVPEGIRREERCCVMNSVSGLKKGMSARLDSYRATETMSLLLTLV